MISTLSGWFNIHPEWCRLWCLSRDPATIGTEEMLRTTWRWTLRHQRHLRTWDGTVGVSSMWRSVVTLPSAADRLCCLTSTEARRPIRDGDGWEKGDGRVKPRHRRPSGRPRLPSSGIAQRPPHHAIAVPTAMQNRVTKTMSVAPPLGNN